MSHHFDSEADALRAARRVCKSLGPNWEPEVWENLGWYFVALCKYGQSIVRVQPLTYGSGYKADLVRAADYPALGIRGDRKRNARAAVLSLWQRLEADVRRLNEACSKIREAIGA